MKTYAVLSAAIIASLSSVASAQSCDVADELLKPLRGVTVTDESPFLSKVWWTGTTLGCNGGHGATYCMDQPVLDCADPLVVPTECDYWKLHLGQDLNGPGDDCGLPVYAIGSGEVVGLSSLNQGTFGRYVLVKHRSPNDASFYSFYAHLSDVDSGIREGSCVAADTILGAVGDSGIATGCHLHFEVRRSELSTETGFGYTHHWCPQVLEKYADPADFIDQYGTLAYDLLPPPTQPKPADGSQLSTLPLCTDDRGTVTSEDDLKVPCFRWTKLSGAHYDLHFGGSFLGRTWINCFYYPATLAFSSYYWQVRPRNAWVSNPFTPEWGFEITNQCTPLSSGQIAGSILAESCLPPETAPSVTTLAASNVGETGGTVNLSVSPFGTATSVWFQWGNSEGSLPYNVPSPAFSVGNGTSPVLRSYTLTNLTCNTSYYFQAWADGYGQPVAGEVLHFQTSSCSGGGGTDPNDLIRNGNFADDVFLWSTTGFFQADDRFGSYRSYPGYAYLANSDGSGGNNLYGELYQEVTIPATAESATLKYWISISTTEASGSSAWDVLTVRIRDQSGNHLAGLEGYSNVDASAGYFSDTFDLSGYIGETVQVHFLGTTDGSNPTIFRVDDVSLIATHDDGSANIGFDLKGFNPSVDDSSPTPGEEIRFTFSTTNVGDETAPDSVPVTYYLDSSVVGHDIEENALDPGDVDIEAHSFNVPDTPGTYYVWGCLEIYLEEPNITNNCTDELELTVAEDPTEGPDIVIAGTTTTHTTVLAGEQFYMTAVAKNVGNKSLSANSIVRFVATFDGPLDIEDLMIGSDAVSWLSVGQERLAEETVTAPLEPGSYLAGACVKVLGEETDTSNNCSPDPFVLTVLPSGCQPATLDLTGFIVTSAELYEACEQISVGPAVSVEAGGSLDLTAPRVSLSGGFAVRPGGTLRIRAPQVEAPPSTFSDDFSDGTINGSLWEYGGSTVTEANGILQIDRTITDFGGWAETTPLQVDVSRLLILERRANVYAAGNYFDGDLTFRWNGDASHPTNFGLSYANYHYTGDGECVTVGFAVFRNAANPHTCANQGVDVTDRISPIWETWFDEKIVYSPASGDLDYYINGSRVLSYNVGAAPSGVDTLTVHFGGWGWGTGHRHHMDDLMIRRSR